MAERSPSPLPCPVYLGGALARRWEELAPELQKLGTLDALNVDLCGKYILAENEYLRVSALVQDDVNDGTHTTYEVALCILKLNSSGIDSVVDKLPAAGLPASALTNRSVTNDKIGLQEVKWENIRDDAITGSKIDKDNTYPHNVGIRHGTASTTSAFLEAIPKSGQIYLKHS